MRHLSRSIRMAIVGGFALVAVLSVVKVSSATGVVNKADLSGNWQIVLGGFTGCGQSTEIANINLNSSGSGTGTVKTHGNCGDSTVTGQTFTINSLSSNGSGTAGLSCGPSCGWAFTIQVSPDRSQMSLVDLTDPGNYLSGTAIHQ